MDYDDLLNEISNSEVDISMLINVLEHTFDFTGLFEKALKSTKNTVVVALPNEENIHNAVTDAEASKPNQPRQITHQGKTN